MLCKMLECPSTTSCTYTLQAVAWEPKPSMRDLIFSIVKEFGYVILEVDEDQHRSYPIGCDVRRDFCIHESVTRGSGHKLRVIHFNPDASRVDDKTRTTTQKERIAKLLEALEEGEPAGLERLFLYYDSVSGATLPQVGASWDKAVQEVSRRFW